MEISARAYENALLNLQECRDRREELRSYPLKLYLEPTEACHLRCTYCYPAEQHSRARMSLETFRRIEEQLFSTACEVNLYLSGEPALCPDLPEMIRICAGYPLVTKTFSSLSYHNDAILESFVEGGVWLNVSFDGAEATRTLRRGSRLDLIERNLQTLGALRRDIDNPRFYLRLASVIGAHNVGELEQLVEWALERGFDEVQLGCLDTSDANRELRLLAEHARCFDDAVSRADALGMRISTPSHIGGQRLPRSSNWKDTPRGIDRFFPHFVETANPDVERRFCPYSWIQSIFTARGDVLACCQRKIPVGRFEADTDFMAEIWNNEMYRRLRRFDDHRGCLLWSPSREPCNMLNYSIWGGETALAKIEEHAQVEPSEP